MARTKRHNNVDLYRIDIDYQFVQSPKFVLDWIKELDKANGKIESEDSLGQFMQYTLLVQNVFMYP